MAHRMEEIKPVHYVTKEECEKMIDYAINKHIVMHPSLVFVLELFFLLSLLKDSSESLV